jgi:hypothetical protein
MILCYSVAFYGSTHFYEFTSIILLTIEHFLPSFRSVLSTFLTEQLDRPMNFLSFSVTN